MLKSLQKRGNMGKTPKMKKKFKKPKKVMQTSEYGEKSKMLQKRRNLVAFVKS